MLEKRVQHLDGLRGLCCLWVMWYHLSEMLNLRSEFDLGLFYRGMVPVYLFFILSGFVIAALIQEKKESYWSFIFRRLFRIWPAFALLSIAGIFCLGFTLDTLALLDNRSAIEQYMVIYQASREYWWQHLLIHFSMLHGFFDETIPFSSKAFIPPGWTITIEWQFYLIAPFLVASFRYGLVALVWAAVYWMQSQYSTKWDGVYLFEYVNYFLMGIASYLAVIKCPQRFRYVLSGLALLGAAYFYYRGFAFTGHIALSLWLIFFSLIYVPEKKLSEPFRRLFDNRFLIFYGEISYSLYLVHMFFVFGVLYFTLQFKEAFNLPIFYVFNVILLTLTATAVAFALYRYVELPCMRWAAKKVRSRNF